MRVVGKTDKGYLCQITVDEMGMIMGFGKYPSYGSEEKKQAFRKALGKSDRMEEIPTNTDIQIHVGMDYIESVRSRIKTAKSAATALRELAEMLESPAPTVILPPAEEPI